MRHYVYTDRSFSPKARATTGTVLFECDAPDILSADALLKDATGFVAIADPTICCAFEDLP